MKRKTLIILAVIPALLSVSCKKKDNGPSYEEKDVNIYRKKDTVDKQIKLRFYETLPNVPYISVDQYFKEFYNIELTKQKISVPFYGNQYYYVSNETGAYLAFDIKNQLILTSSLEAWNYSPDFISSTGKIFIERDTIEATTPSAATFSMKDYSIPIYEGNKAAYIPLSLLSSITGGLATFDVAYNGKDLYVIDMNGLLGTVTSASYFGDSYYSELSNDKARPQDLIDYNYNELCFVFDNLRGYTTQLHFGDQKLIDLGLDKLLSQEHPKIKEYLRSSKKANYFEGLNALFNGLYDGGHTGIINKFSAFNDAVNRKSETEFAELIDFFNESTKDSAAIKSSFLAYRISELGSGSGGYFWYHYDSATKTAYIIFNGFAVDYEGWDKFYNGTGEIPVETDTYAYVRDKMYQAKLDGAENLVLDLCANGGGSSYALEGVMGLFNGAKSYINTQDIVNSYSYKDKHKIDINLDGKWDEEDEQEAAKFNFNVGVLTSKYAFSCGNLLPANMKELGYKIIGEKSGGGSCAVSLDSTSDGVPYVHSSYICLTDSKGTNIDSGIDVDFAIEKPKIDNLYDCSEFYNFTSVSEYLSSAYSN